MPKKLSDEAVIEVARAIETAHNGMVGDDPAPSYVNEARSFVAAFNAAIDVMERPEPEPEPVPDTEVHTDTLVVNDPGS